MEKTTVMLLPVCKCGNVIAGLEVDQIIDSNGWKCKRPFTPERCPRCNKMIEYMTVDTKFLKAFVDFKE